MDEGALAAVNFAHLNVATLILIGIGALLAIAVIIWGTIRRRAKAKAVRRSEAHERIVNERHATHGESIPSTPPEIHEPVAEPPLAPEPPAVAMAPAVMPEPEISPAPLPEPAPEQAPSYPLTTLKGLGPRAASALAAQGIDSVAALAALSEEQAAAVDASLGALAGRLSRDRWVEQARLLAGGDVAGFESAFGKL